MSESNRPQTIAPGLLGAAVGGCLGCFIFFWIAQQGFYAPALFRPGFSGWAPVFAPARDHAF